eukprot:626343-Prorocentrum_minimum.AAC.2
MQAGGHTPSGSRLPELAAHLRAPCDGFNPAALEHYKGNLLASILPVAVTEPKVAKFTEVAEPRKKLSPSTPSMRLGARLIER